MKRVLILGGGFGGPADGFANQNRAGAIAAQQNGAFRDMPVVLT
jgi:hypothetical protein